MKTNEQEHLPVMGIGPVCIAIMIAFTAAGITVVKFDLLTSGNVRSAIILSLPEYCVLVAASHCGALQYSVPVSILR